MDRLVWKPSKDAKTPEFSIHNLITRIWRCDSREGGDREYPFQMFANSNNCSIDGMMEEQTAESILEHLGRYPVLKETITDQETNEVVQRIVRDQSGIIRVLLLGDYYSNTTAPAHGMSTHGLVVINLNHLIRSGITQVDGIQPENLAFLVAADSGVCHHKDDLALAVRLVGFESVELKTLKAIEDSKDEAGRKEKVVEQRLSYERVASTSIAVKLNSLILRKKAAKKKKKKAANAMAIDDEDEEKEPARAQYVSAVSKSYIVTLAPAAVAYLGPPVSGKPSLLTEVDLHRKGEQLRFSELDNGMTWARPLMIFAFSTEQQKTKTEAADDKYYLPFIDPEKVAALETKCRSFDLRRNISGEIQFSLTDIASAPEVTILSRAHKKGTEVELRNRDGSVSPLVYDYIARYVLDPHFASNAYYALFGEPVNAVLRLPIFKDKSDQNEDKSGVWPYGEPIKLPSGRKKERLSVRVILADLQPKEFATFKHIPSDSNQVIYARVNFINSKTASQFKVNQYGLRVIEPSSKAGRLIAEKLDAAFVAEGELQKQRANYKQQLADRIARVEEKENDTSEDRGESEAFKDKDEDDDDKVLEASLPETLASPQKSTPKKAKPKTPQKAKPKKDKAYKPKKEDDDDDEAMEGLPDEEDPVKFDELSKKMQAKAGKTRSGKSRSSGARFDQRRTAGNGEGDSMDQSEDSGKDEKKGGAEAKMDESKDVVAPQTPFAIVELSLELVDQATQTYQVGVPDAPASLEENDVREEYGLPLLKRKLQKNAPDSEGDSEMGSLHVPDSDDETEQEVEQQGEQTETQEKEKKEEEKTPVQAKIPAETKKSLVGFFAKDETVPAESSFDWSSASVQKLFKDVSEFVRTGDESLAADNSARFVPTKFDAEQTKSANKLQPVSKLQGVFEIGDVVEFKTAPTLVPSKPAELKLSELETLALVNTDAKDGSANYMTGKEEQLFVPAPEHNKYVQIKCDGIVFDVFSVSARIPQPDDVFWHMASATVYAHAGKTMPNNISPDEDVQLYVRCHLNLAAYGKGFRHFRVLTLASEPGELATPFYRHVIASSKSMLSFTQTNVLLERENVNLFYQEGDVAAAPNAQLKPLKRDGYDLELHRDGVKIKLKTSSEGHRLWMEVKFSRPKAALQTSSVLINVWKRPAGDNGEKIPKQHWLTRANIVERALATPSTLCTVRTMGKLWLTWPLDISENLPNTPVLVQAGSILSEYFLNTYDLSEPLQLQGPDLQFPSGSKKNEINVLIDFDSPKNVAWKERLNMKGFVEAHEKMTAEIIAASSAKPRTAPKPKEKKAPITIATFPIQAAPASLTTKKAQAIDVGDFKGFLLTELGDVQLGTYTQTDKETSLQRVKLPDGKLAVEVRANPTSSLISVLFKDKREGQSRWEIISWYKLMAAAHLQRFAVPTEVTRLLEFQVTDITKAPPRNYDGNIDLEYRNGSNALDYRIEAILTQPNENTIALVKDYSIRVHDESALVVDLGDSKAKSVLVVCKKPPHNFLFVVKAEAKSRFVVLTFTQLFESARDTRCRFYSDKEKDQHAIIVSKSDEPLEDVEDGWNQATVDEKAKSLVPNTYNDVDWHDITGAPEISPMDLGEDKKTPFKGDMKQSSAVFIWPLDEKKQFRQEVAITVDTKSAKKASDVSIRCSQMELFCVNQLMANLQFVQKFQVKVAYRPQEEESQIALMKDGGGVGTYQSYETSTQGGFLSFAILNSLPPSVSVIKRKEFILLLSEDDGLLTRKLQLLRLRRSGNGDYKVFTIHGTEKFGVQKKSADGVYAWLITYAEFSEQLATMGKPDEAMDVTEDGETSDPPKLVAPKAPPQFKDDEKFTVEKFFLRDDATGIAVELSQDGSVGLHKPRIELPRQFEKTGKGAIRPTTLAVECKLPTGSTFYDAMVASKNDANLQFAVLVTEQTTRTKFFLFKACLNKTRLSATWTITQIRQAMRNAKLIPTERKDKNAQYTVGNGAFKISGDAQAAYTSLINRVSEKIKPTATIPNPVVVILSKPGFVPVDKTFWEQELTEFRMPKDWSEDDDVIENQLAPDTEKDKGKGKKGKKGKGPTADSLMEEKAPKLTAEEKKLAKTFEEQKQPALSRVFTEVKGGKEVLRDEKEPSKVELTPGRFMVFCRGVNSDKDKTSVHLRVFDATAENTDPVIQNIDDWLETTFKMSFKESSKTKAKDNPLVVCEELGFFTGPIYAGTKGNRTHHLVAHIYKKSIVAANEPGQWHTICSFHDNERPTNPKNKARTAANGGLVFWGQLIDKFSGNKMKEADKGIGMYRTNQGCLYVRSKTADRQSLSEVGDFPVMIDLPQPKSGGRGGGGGGGVKRSNAKMSTLGPLVQGTTTPLPPAKRQKTEEATDEDKAKDATYDDPLAGLSSNPSGKRKRPKDEEGKDELGSGSKPKKAAVEPTLEPIWIKSFKEGVTVLKKVEEYFDEELGNPKLAKLLPWDSVAKCDAEVKAIKEAKVPLPEVYALVIEEGESKKPPVGLIFIRPAANKQSIRVNINVLDEAAHRLHTVTWVKIITWLQPKLEAVARGMLNVPTGPVVADLKLILSPNIATSFTNSQNGSNLMSKFKVGAKENIQEIDEYDFALIETAAAPAFTLVVDVPQSPSSAVTPSAMQQQAPAPLPSSSTDSDGDSSMKG